MTLWHRKYDHLDIRLVFGLSIGLGVMYMPLINQAGIIFTFFSLVINWEDKEQEDFVTQEAEAKA